MNNPSTQFKYAFEFWAAAVFGVYSHDFYEWNEWLFRDPRYTQENLTGRFWQEINEGWDWMQPYMIEHLERLKEEDEQWDTITPNLQPCPLCGGSTVDPATCLNWRSEFVGPLWRYRCALRPPATPSAPHDFTEGQSITVEGIQGTYAYLNGTYVVDSVNQDRITP